MASHCVDTARRTKCSGLLGLRCEWWLWCISLWSLTSCVAQGPSAVIHPTDDVFVKYGDDLRMQCSATGDYKAEDLSFTFSGTELPTKIINNKTIELFLQKPLESRGTYYCKNAKTGYITTKTVFVMSSPGKVTDFKCISRNLEVLNCTWTTPDHDSFTNYTLTFTMYGSTVLPCVAHYLYNSYDRYCYWNTTSKPRYRQQEPVYQFILYGWNEISNMTQNFTIDHFAIVKSDPPENLKNLSATSHSVLLQWVIPRNLHNFVPDQGSIVHKIEYQIAKIDNTSFFRQVDTSLLSSKNKIYVFNLTNLPYAHRQYGVRVYVKTRRASDEYWSDFSHKLIYTASERPQRPPDTIAGAFDQSIFQNRRLLKIYWKQLEEYEEAGANFTYKVLVIQGSRTRTYEPDKDKSLGFLSLDDPNISSQNALEIRVRSFNEIGSSEKSSYLYIPAERDTIELHLTSFTKLAYENGTYELSWKGSQYNIDNYTLFWCQHNATNICTGQINFTVLEATKNKHIINLPRDYRYQFAISANKGLKTSGMIWAKCDISKEGIAMFDFPIRFVDHDAPGKTYVKLKWSMDCTLKEGIINGYNITYCPVKGLNGICDSSLGHFPEPFIISDSKQMEATIKDLRPYTTYMFRMALKTTYGLKNIENTTVSITTLEDTPTKPRNVTILDVQYDSIVVSWDLPMYLNGHISQISYIIRYNESMTIENSRRVKYEEKLFKIKMDRLKPFTNYTVTVEACNEGINSCSGQTTPLLIRTRIGPPSEMISPSLKNNILSWIPPTYPGGTLDMYQIKIVKDSREEELQNTTASSLYVTSCEGAVLNVTYQVRAINFDEDANHGTWTDSSNVTLPFRDDPIPTLTFYGQWSKESTVLCKSKDTMFLLFILMGVVVVIAFGFSLLKFYRKIRKMGDIKPEFPKGLFVPEKEISKYPFPGIYPSDKDEKPTSDEMLLLPNSKASVSTPEIKNNDNCASSEHTDSTGLSDASQPPVDRQNSTSDESTHSSLQLEIAAKRKDNEESLEERDTSNTDNDSSGEDSPYFSNSTFKKNMVSGYVQPVVSPVSGYVQTAVSPASGYVQAVPIKNVPAKTIAQPTTSSYVMAGLPSPAIFSAGALTPTGAGQPPPPTGYVRAEDVDARKAMNFPKLGPSPTKVFGTESLPIIPNLPTPPKSADSSYIQLQSLDGLPSHKQRSTVPYKPAATSGYVRPEDAVINKHLNNFLSGTHPGEDLAVLDPTMSPDAYCRISWSTDPANDNLHSLLATSPNKPV